MKPERRVEALPSSLYQKPAYREQNAYLQGHEPFRKVVPGRLFSKIFALRMPIFAKTYAREGPSLRKLVLTEVPGRAADRAQLRAEAGRIVVHLEIASG